jgi:YgiT-type zinc finger domain-containing protein
MSQKVCNFCGHFEYIEKRVEYIYRHQHRYMVFRDVPSEVCLHCGMRYFAAETILNIEQRFFEVVHNHQPPIQTITVPVETFG